MTQKHVIRIVLGEKNKLKERLRIRGDKTLLLLIPKESTEGRKILNVQQAGVAQWTECRQLSHEKA